MFQGRKYITRGVNSEIDISLQLIIWQMIEEIKNKDIELDYLQVFNLKRKIVNDKVIQEIKHSQEVPSFENTITVMINKPVNAKIFIISSNDENVEEYSTMMLADEY